MIFTSFLLLALLATVEALPIQNTEVEFDTLIGYTYLPAHEVKTVGTLQQGLFIGPGEEAYLYNKVFSNPIDYLPKHDNYHQCMIYAHRQSFIEHGLVFVTGEMKQYDRRTVLEEYLGGSNPGNIKIEYKNPILISKNPPHPLILGGRDPDEFEMRIPADSDALNELGVYCSPLACSPKDLPLIEWDTWKEIKLWPSTFRRKSKVCSAGHATPSDGSDHKPVGKRANTCPRMDPKLQHLLERACSAHK
ncbi:hypothetical protein BDP27DRAFT_1406183 [Rhodocollybia butyracea]|uniref:Uncharacterized protein n=1 Tax=Rhodocollybia butyracea TaxID=206335 RepID=A0A9P5U2E7_9AGAR|nr:hypothetical protein BDP27DRAFT_1406183 [Rhodocollybia butyracea]